MGKRSFYEDDELIIAKPGTNQAISTELKEQESVHHASFVEGMAIRTTPILEKYTNSIRHYLHDKVSLADAELETQKSAFNNEWTSIKLEYHSIVQDPVLPGLIYILTIALSGSILVRRKSLPLRFAAPTVFGGVALSYYMPNTYCSIVKKYNQLEKENVPEFHSQRQTLLENYEQFKKELDAGLVNTNKSIESGIHDLREALKDIWP